MSRRWFTDISISISLRRIVFNSPKSLKVAHSDQVTHAVFITGAMHSRPLVNPRNTGVVASQTRLDASQTDLGRRPCRVISGHFAFNTTQRPRRDPRCEVRNIVCDAFDGDVSGQRCLLRFLEMEGVYFESSGGSFANA